MFRIKIEIGVPSVFPSNIPLRISAVSGSLRAVTEADFIPLIAAPGRLLSNACWIFAVSTESPAGQPSIITPSASPWLSPKVVTLKIEP